MKGKDENKEIQSRREFFKSATKKVLPILGAVTLPQILFSKNIKEESLETDCNWGCSSGCKGGCGRVCSYNCTNSCAGGCDGSCKGYCMGSCKRSCYRNNSY